MNDGFSYIDTGYPCKLIVLEYLSLHIRQPGSTNTVCLMLHGSYTMTSITGQSVDYNMTNMQLERSIYYRERESNARIRTTQFYIMLIRSKVEGFNQPLPNMVTSRLY